MKRPDKKTIKFTDTSNINDKSSFKSFDFGETIFEVSENAMRKMDEEWVIIMNDNKSVRDQFLALQNEYSQWRDSTKRSHSEYKMPPSEETANVENEEIEFDKDEGEQNEELFQIEEECLGEEEAKKESQVDEANGNKDEVEQELVSEGNSETENKKIENEEYKSQDDLEFIMGIQKKSNERCKSFTPDDSLVEVNCSDAFSGLIGGFIKATRLWDVVVSKGQRIHHRKMEMNKESIVVKQNDAFISKKQQAQGSFINPAFLFVVTCVAVTAWIHFGMYKPRLESREDDVSGESSTLEFKPMSMQQELVVIMKFFTIGICGGYFERGKVLV